jgi:hypothetical protein
MSDYDDILSFTKEEIENGYFDEWLKYSGLDQFLIDDPEIPTPPKKKNLHPPSTY